MATRRRIGVSAATTEAARRQLMQPVPCWEKTWVVPDTAPAGSTLKILKWIKTEKTQQFSDDEGEVDEPLAPLPDDPEGVEGDEEMEQDEVVIVEPESTQLDVIDSELPKQSQEPPSKPPSPKPQTLSMSLQPASELVIEDPGDVLDASLKPLDTGMEDEVDVGNKLTTDVGIELDMSGLGPDGLGLESSHDLSQMEEADALMGGPLLDETVDPFAEPMNE